MIYFLRTLKDSTECFMEERFVTIIQIVFDSTFLLCQLYLDAPVLEFQGVANSCPHRTNSYHTNIEMESGRVGSARTLPEPEEVSPNPARNRGLIKKPDSAQQ